MPLNRKYGQLALVAGASEGLGAAFSHCLAASGMDLVLVARRREPLEKLAVSLAEEHHVKVLPACFDLSDMDAASKIKEFTGDREIDLLVYNAALSHIGPFENADAGYNARIAITNMLTPMNLIRIFGEGMLERKRGAIVLMSSLAGFQGSGFLAAYAATKSFNMVLAESLWYEWRSKGLDVIACCAGATATENYIRTNPGKSGFFAPAVQSPAEVVNECFKWLGKRPSFISGRGNRLAGFIMQRLLPRKMSVKIMGDNTRKLYGI